MADGPATPPPGGYRLLLYRSLGNQRIPYRAAEVHQHDQTRGAPQADPPMDPQMHPRRNPRRQRQPRSASEGETKTVPIQPVHR
jgi:hypothetical protein